MNVNTDGSKRYASKQEIDASFDIVESILTELFVQASEYNKYRKQDDDDKCNKALLVIYALNRILVHNRYSVDIIIDQSSHFIEDITVNGIGIYKNLPEPEEDELQEYLEYTDTDGGEVNE